MRSRMAHIAMQGEQDSKHVDRLEHVTGEKYAVDLIALPSGEKPAAEVRLRARSCRSADMKSPARVVSFEAALRGAGTKTCVT